MLISRAASDSLIILLISSTLLASRRACLKEGSLTRVLTIESTFKCSLVDEDGATIIKNNFESTPKFTKDDISRFDELLTIVVEEYTKMAKNEVQKAFFVNFDDEINNLLNNYVDNVGAYLEDSTVEDDFGEHHEPDEHLMRSIEEKVGVSEAAKDSFRQEVFRKVIGSKAATGTFDYTSHARLREALQSQLFDERSDVIRLTVTSRNPDPEALEKLNSVIKTLVEKHGYNHDSANQLLRYVNSIMAKQ